MFHILINTYFNSIFVEILIEKMDPNGIGTIVLSFNIINSAS